MISNPTIKIFIILPIIIIRLVLSRDQQSLYLPHKTLVGKTKREMEKNHILNVLIEAIGNCSEAARLLGISPHDPV